MNPSWLILHMIDALRPRDPFRRRTPPPPITNPFRQGPARTFMGWPNLTYKDPLP